MTLEETRKTYPNKTKWAETDIPRFLRNFDIRAEFIGLTISPSGERYYYKSLNLFTTARLKKAADMLKNGNGYILERNAEGGGFSVFAPYKNADGKQEQHFLRYAEMGGALHEMEEKSETPLVLGRGENGFFKTDLDELCHILIAGTTGSGKSCLMNSLICELLAYSHVQLFLIDPKQGAEFGMYGDSEMLASHFRLGVPVAKTTNDAVFALKVAETLMRDRYKEMAKKGQKKSTDEHVVIFIDELADLMMTNKERIEPLIVKIAQMGRAANIHLIIATQDPRAQVITGLIKYNMPTKICLKTANGRHSMNVIDRTDGVKLLGKGDAYVLTPSSCDLIRIQCPYITDDQIKYIIT